MGFAVLSRGGAVHHFRLVAHRIGTFLIYPFGRVNFGGGRAKSVVHVLNILVLVVRLPLDLADIKVLTLGPADVLC